jgi:hypothetical protein
MNSKTIKIFGFKVLEVNYYSDDGLLPMPAKKPKKSKGGVILDLTPEEWHKQQKNGHLSKN